MVAEVIINSNVRNLNRIFDYEIPDEMISDVFVGSRILVPFGNQKKLEEGFVVGLKEESSFKLKAIAKIEDKKYLDEDKISLAKMMSDRYFCNISDCIKLMLPPGTTTKNFDNRINDKLARMVYLNKEKEDIEDEIENGIIKSDKQIRALRFLLNNEGVVTTDLQIFADVSNSILKTLEKNGYIEIRDEEVERNPFIHKNVKPSSNLKLTEEQQAAFDSINISLELAENKEYLLFGVTGSGKTEIYIQLIEQVLKENKTSIMLVPEISLTPQTVDRFISRFGEEKIAVLHSKLSIGERYDQWKKIAKGEAKIVIGARSAIFAPVNDLGIIIIDEEHDESYKSETNPRYNAKDIARFLAKKNSVPLVLGTATPDIKTFEKTEKGDICLLELSQRANKLNLPKVEIVDLREELSQGNKSMISRRLKEEIEKNLENRKQTILFLNRRGFSTFIMCRDCGYTAKCKNCNITLTYHSHDNKLKCHYCGYETSVLKKCPECNSENIRYFGGGTQKLEDEIKKLFPGASIIRMDVDTVGKKNSYEDILGTFRENGIDILIGTQMVVKGHDFPNVTLVGVIAADTSLNIDDYRANERTFQILTQVAGRAGRGKDEGRVIVQTYNPDNFTIEFAKNQNYKEFYETEIEIRKQLRYPPFCDIMLIGIEGINQKEIINLSNNIYQYLDVNNKKHNLELSILKPIPAPIDRIKNKIRWRIIVKGKFNINSMNLLNQLIKDIDKQKKRSKNTRIIVDINPNNML